MNSAEKWMETHTGDDCSNCGLSYAACTNLVFGSQQTACCTLCFIPGAHHERAVPVPLTPAQWLAERRAELVRAYDCAEAYRALPAALSALEKVLERATKEQDIADGDDVRRMLTQIVGIIEKELNA